MAFLDGTVVNVALPDIGRDFDASTSALQWILNGYLLTLASLILLGGSLGDRYGRRRVFVLGIGLFTVASLLCAAAPNVEVLIAARLLQGIGGALLTPGSLALIEASFRPDRPRPRDRRLVGARRRRRGDRAAARRLPDRRRLLAGDLHHQPAARHLRRLGRRPPRAGVERPRRQRPHRPLGRGPGGGRPRRHHLRADRGPRPGSLGGGPAQRGPRRRRPRRLLLPRGADPQPDAAAGDLPLAPVQRRQRGHLRRLRRPRRRLLPARRLPPDLARTTPRSRPARPRCRSPS